MTRRIGDRRKEPRFEIVGDLWATVETTSSLVVRNLGHGGALLEAAQPLAADSVHWVTALADGEPHLLQLRVRHSSPVTADDGAGSFLIGVEFMKLSPALEDAIVRQVRSSIGTLPAE